MAVYRAFERLTNKQQEMLRLKFQFGFNLEEVARITAVGKAGAGGLLHFALERICHATGSVLSLGADQRIDVRLTAYALDEMEPAEKKHFVESVPNGKALLESSDAIRKAGLQLTGVLESGAPLPKRRRRRRRGAGWRFPVLMLAGVAVVAGLAWYFWPRSGETGDALEDTSAIHGDYAGSTRVRAEEAGGSGRVCDSSSSHNRTDRSPRPGEAEWERKPFGRGNGHGNGPGSGPGAAASAGGAARRRGRARHHGRRQPQSRSGEWSDEQRCAGGGRSRQQREGGVRRVHAPGRSRGGRTATASQLAQ